MIKSSRGGKDSPTTKSTKETSYPPLDCEVSFYSAFLIILERDTLEEKQLDQEKDAMAEQQLIGAFEAGGTKMVCATGYADGTVLEREQIVTTTPAGDRRGRQRMACRQGHRRPGHRRFWQ